MTSIARLDYAGWPNCYRISNGIADLVVTTDVGPRIIRFGFTGQENEFAEYAEMAGLTGGGEWRIYGGHRLWVAPEDPPSTYAPDNDPVRFEDSDGAVRLTQPAPGGYAIEKAIEVRLSDDAAEVRVSHTLCNLGPAPVTIAPWALSVMAPGGRATVPLPPRATHGDGNLLPASAIGLWAYTDMTDSRWQWGRDSITLDQDARAATPQKAGFAVPDGWCAYDRAGHRFTKRFAYDPGARYPDFGCNVELYTDARMLELETLGPLCDLQPGGSTEHTETWELRAAEPA